MNKCKFFLHMSEKCLKHIRIMDGFFLRIAYPEDNCSINLHEMANKSYSNLLGDYQDIIDLYADYLQNLINVNSLVYDDRIWLTELSN